MQEPSRNDEGSAGLDGRISLADAEQVREWAAKLGISAERLRELVAQVGPRVCDVQQRLSQPGAVD